MIKILFIHKPINENLENTVLDCLNSFSKYSQHTIDFIPSDEFNTKQVELGQYSCICLYKFHFTKETDLSFHKKKEIRDFKGVKVVFLEEEYFILHERIKNIIFMNIDIVFTALPEKAINSIYGNYKNNFKIIKVFHGYIDEHYISVSLPEYAQRKIDLSYRALDLPYFYGRLGMEKKMIGDFSLKYFNGFGLNLNISNHFHDRLWGDSWIDFLKDSKAVLGVECGSGVVDYGQAIFRNSIEYQQKQPNCTFKDVESLFFKGLDGQYDISGISPRIFEYAALKCLMILFEGDYEHILKPGYHYLALKKDFSNIEEIIDTIKKPEKAKIIIDNAYNDIALESCYHFKNYVKGFDREVGNYIEKKSREKEEVVVFPKTPHTFIAKKSILSSKALDSAQAILKRRIKPGSFLYRITRFSYRYTINLVKLYTLVVSPFKKRTKALRLFFSLLPHCDTAVYLLELTRHLRDREKMLEKFFLKLRTYNNVGEIEFSECDKSCLQTQEIFDALLKHGCLDFLVIKLDLAWCLQDFHRNNKIYKVNYNILKVISEAMKE